MLAVARLNIALLLVVMAAWVASQFRAFQLSHAGDGKVVLFMISRGDMLTEVDEAGEGPWASGDPHTDIEVQPAFEFDPAVPMGRYLPSMEYHVGADPTPPWFKNRFVIGQLVWQQSGFGRLEPEGRSKRLILVDLWRTNIFLFPLWILFILPAALALWFYGRRLKPWFRFSRHLCTRCGYDLRATPGRCPECGTEQPASSSRTRPASS